HTHIYIYKQYIYTYIHTHSHTHTHTQMLTKHTHSHTHTHTHAHKTHTHSHSPGAMQSQYTWVRKCAHTQKHRSEVKIAIRDPPTLGTLNNTGPLNGARELLLY